MANEMFPGVASAQASGPCAWCGRASARDYVVVPPITGTDKRTGQKVVKKAAITARACDSCTQRLDAQNPKLSKDEKPMKKKAPRYVVR